MTDKEQRLEYALRAIANFPHPVEAKALQYYAAIMVGDEEAMSRIMHPINITKEQLDSTALD